MVSIEVIEFINNNIGTAIQQKNKEKTDSVEVLTNRISSHFD